MNVQATTEERALWKLAWTISQMSGQDFYGGEDDSPRFRQLRRLLPFLHDYVTGHLIVTSDNATTADLSEVQLIIEAISDAPTGVPAEAIREAVIEAWSASHA